MSPVERSTVRGQPLHDQTVCGPGEHGNHARNGITRPDEREAEEQGQCQQQFFHRGLVVEVHPFTPRWGVGLVIDSLTAKMVCSGWPIVPSAVSVRSAIDSATVITVATPNTALTTG